MTKESRKTVIMEEGTRVGMLTINSYVGARSYTSPGGWKYKRHFYSVTCDCGNIKEVEHHSIRKGNT